MRRKRLKGNEEEINFWQPASDMFSALLLILMLVILLLGLYLIQIPEYNLKDPDAGNTYADSDVHEGDYTSSPVPTATAIFWFPGGGDGGGGYGDGDNTPHPTYVDPGETASASPTPTVSPTPDLPGGGAAGGGGGSGGGAGAGEGIGDDPDKGMKSAAYVMIVDAETNRTIKEANVQFELYGENHSLQVLNVYYPERISYRLYETTEAGTFYFPEKLTLGTYELHELTEPEGYDASQNITFDLNEVFDWSDPLVVKVPIYPSRNIIRLKMSDAETGQPLAGGEFDVVAAENIITSDGTLRYRLGQTVSEIICDESGIGESEELYLGTYLIRQRVIPEYYIGISEDIEAETEKKSGTLPPFHTISSTRTKIRLALKDELYPTRGIKGAVFTVSRAGSSEIPLEVTTNSAGELVLDSLDKGTTYQIRQVSTEDLYRLDENTYSVFVDSYGRIEDEEETTLELFNHMIRVSIGITDEFSNVQVADVNLSLFDSTGTLIHSWTSTGAPMPFNGLEPGAYYVIRDGDTSTRLDIQVQDVIEVQYINLQTSYLMRYFIIGGAGMAVLIVAAVIVIVILRRRKKKKG